MKTVTLRLVKILAGLAVALLVLHTVLLVASGLALRNARAELRAAGRPMKPYDIIPKVVPAAENAAPLYESAFALLKSESLDGQGLIKALELAAQEYSAQPDSEEKRDALTQLLANETVIRALALIDQASVRPECDFDLQYNLGADMMLPHLHDMLTVGQVLLAKTLLETRQGNRESAWQTAELALRMAGARRREPIILTALYRFSQYHFALMAVRTVAEAFPPDDATTARLEGFISAEDNPAPYVALVMDGHRLLMGDWAFQKLALQEAKYSFTAGEAFDWKLLMMEMARRYRPALQADHAVYLRAMLAGTQASQRPYWETGPEPDGEPEFPWYSFFTPRGLPGFSMIRIIPTQAQAYARVTQTGLALLRHKAAHGAYPPALAGIDSRFLAEILTDPFTGQPLVYRQEGDGFVLYSLGENLQDDNGTERTKDTSKSRAFDIVWRTAR